MGQTQDRQIDCLRDLGAALRNEDNSLWTMRNGYALCTESGLASIAQMLDAYERRRTGSLRDRLRVGLHWDVEVTGRIARGPRVTGLLFGAPVAYTRSRAPDGRPSRRLCSRPRTKRRVGRRSQYASNHVEHRLADARRRWRLRQRDGVDDDGAIRRALKMVAHVGLDVRLVSYGQPDRELVQLVEDFT